MALEVDALVRSIEDEKIDEDAREKVKQLPSLSDIPADFAQSCRLGTLWLESTASRTK